MTKQLMTQLDRAPTGDLFSLAFTSWIGTLCVMYMCTKQRPIAASDLFCLTVALNVLPSTLACSGQAFLEQHIAST